MISPETQTLAIGSRDPSFKLPTFETWLAHAYPNYFESTPGENSNPFTFHSIILNFFITNLP